MFGLFKCNGCCVASSNGGDIEQGFHAPEATKRSIWFDMNEGSMNMSAATEMRDQKENLVERREVLLENGARYAGQWLGDRRHGRGVILRADGCKYAGQFRDDRASGYGKFMHWNG